LIPFLGKTSGEGQAQALSNGRHRGLWMNIETTFFIAASAWDRIKSNNAK